MTNRVYDMNDGQETDTPFSEMYLISGVYSVRKKNGSIIASVRCRSYAMAHPFVGYSAYDDVEHCVYYYTRDIHGMYVIFCTLWV